ncbi:mandelate racemase/muconate lactonizing enzyme family protein [Pseudaestuariivita rosea]|uniref:mandelate racemase/muconate lactonizing enzyme family protein n=1 Tax=Pseudaestuariivita rosea TaxID=2763263 RepID=UPI001ABB6E26|nr:mandelate racemase/muconate lactonizing enzyme family protein [Pseudaestuariivita rosea]
MKITDVKIETFKWPRPRPLSNGKHTYTTQGMTLISIETDQGITGIGQAATRSVVRATLEHFVPMLIGRNPLHHEALWRDMWSPKRIGRRGMTTRAISAIDIALWDIKAKAANMPLSVLLGQFRDRCETYVAGGYYADGKGLKELADEMESYVKMGARAVKMKIGAVPIKEDVARVKAARDAIGPDVKLLVDANCAYLPYQAMDIARRMEEHDVFWFEEPMEPDDYDGFRRLSAKTSIPVATGENEYTKFGFRDLIQSRGAEIINPDAKICGGITEFMKIAAYAQAHNIAIAPHGQQEVHVHLNAACENAILLEYYPKEFDPMWGKIFKHTPEINEDGTVSPPDVPGLGMEPLYENLNEYRVA